MPDLDLEDSMTAERDPEFGVVSLKIADLSGREWAVSIPYPDDGDIDETLGRLRDALDVLTYRARAVPIEAGDDDA